MKLPILTFSFFLLACARGLSLVLAVSLYYCLVAFSERTGLVYVCFFLRLLKAVRGVHVGRRASGSVGFRLTVFFSSCLSMFLPDK